MRVTSPTALVLFPGRTAAAVSSHTRAAVPATMSVTWQLHAQSQHGGWHNSPAATRRGGLRAGLAAAEGPAGRGGTRQGSDAAVPSAKRCASLARAAPCLHHTATAGSRQQRWERLPGGTAPGPMPERPDPRSIPSAPARTDASRPQEGHLSISPTATAEAERARK